VNANLHVVQPDGYGEILKSQQLRRPRNNEHFPGSVSVAPAPAPVPPLAPAWWASRLTMVAAVSVASKETKGEGFEVQESSSSDSSMRKSKGEAARQRRMARRESGSSDKSSQDSGVGQRIQQTQTSSQIQGAPLETSSLESSFSDGSSASSHCSRN
jgi:hypothetical protein